MSDTKLKTREPLTTRQRTILVSFYNQNPYPSASERHQLVQITGRTPKQVQDWFANRRRSDPKFVSNKPTTAAPPAPPPPSTSTTTEMNYYYNLPPPPPPPPCMSSLCPCCHSAQSYVNETFSPIFYSPTMTYYSPMDYYHS